MDYWNVEIDIASNILAPSFEPRPIGREKVSRRNVSPEPFPTQCAERPTPSIA